MRKVRVTLDILEGQNLQRRYVQRRYVLVCLVVPAAELVDTAIQMGEKISKLSKPVVMLAKEAVNASYETTLDQGILFERRLFHSTFGTVRTFLQFVTH